MKKSIETSKKISTVLCDPNYAMQGNSTHSIETTDYSTFVELIHRILIETEGAAI